MVLNYVLVGGVVYDNPIERVLSLIKIKLYSSLCVVLIML